MIRARLASPCRPHNCSPEHAAMVLAYREARAQYESEREAACGDWATEIAEYNRDHDGGVTFASFCQAWRGSAQDRTDWEGPAS